MIWQPDFGQSVFDTISTSSFLQVELVILATGFAPAAEISASKYGQDASGLAPDAIHFVKNQTYDFPFVSSAGLAPAVLTMENMMGSDLPTRFRPVGF